jgi:hypothetical protein
MPEQTPSPQVLVRMGSGPEQAPKHARGDARRHVASHGPIEGSPGGRPCAKRWRAFSRACSLVRDEEGRPE